MIKEQLLKLQKQLWDANINASYAEHDEGGDYSLEWWGLDGSLNGINEWDDGDIVFYKSLNGTRLVFHTVRTLEDFENYLATFPALDSTRTI
jgi:hypothetical protein